MLPKMITRVSGTPTPTMSRTRSRASSFSSVTVSRPSAKRRPVAAGAAGMTDIVVLLFLLLAD
jgi:hypothetical protein